MSDPQDQAEALDEGVVECGDDRTGDRYGSGLPDFPPEEPLGVDATGTTPVEEDSGESFAERSSHREPDAGDAAGDRSGSPVAPEDLAMHLEPDHDHDR